MPVLASEIKLYKSSNGVGLGGSINTSAEIVGGDLNNVFDDVSSSEALAGRTEYRCVYVRNNNASLALLNTRIWNAANTESEFTNIQIGLGTAGPDASEQTIPDETTAPGGVTFDDAEDYDNGIVIGDIGANGGYHAVWLKRVVDPNAESAARDSTFLSVRGETTS